MMKVFRSKGKLATAVVMSAGVILLGTILFYFLPLDVGSKAGPVCKYNPEDLSGESALAEARMFLAVGPRVSGTQGAKEASSYIATRLQGFGVKTVVVEFNDHTAQGAKVFRNVVGVVPGTASNYVILASHYDTKAGISERFSGANDSGSSTGLLLELAELIMKDRITVDGPGIMFVFFDGEECLNKYTQKDGLHGSRNMAIKLKVDQQIENVLGFILLDMIGDRDLNITLPRNCSQVMLQKVLEAAKAQNLEDKVSITPKYIVDDHMPFLAAGIPSVVLIDFEYGSGKGRNDYWHTEEDTVDKLSSESLGEVGRLVLEMLNSYYMGL